MEKRAVGQTGMMASVVGLGTEHLDRQPAETVNEVIDAALDHGINMMDVFMPGEEVRAHIGRALDGRRDRVLIQGHIGSTDEKEQYDMSRDLATCQRYFETLLRCLRTDYIDFGMLFFMDSHDAIDAMRDNGVVAYARRLKEQGTIRAIGASAHNPVTAKRLVEEGMVDMLMFSINPAFDLMAGAEDIESIMGEGASARMTRADPARAELYRLCQQKGVGITVMKSLGAGNLLSAEHTPFARPLTPVQCIHYALTRPAVASVMVGCRTRAEVEAAVGYATASAAERDYTEAIARFRVDGAGGEGGFAGQCVYCNHCLPCPSRIDVAAVNKYRDIARLDPAHIPPSVAQHYAALEAHGGDCVSCGSCEERCPFGVPVMDQMREAAALFGK